MKQRTLLSTRAQWNAMTKAASYAQKVRFHNISSCWKDWRYCPQQNNIIHIIAILAQFTSKFLWRYATFTRNIVILKHLKTAQIRHYCFSLNQIRFTSPIWESETLKRIYSNKRCARMYCPPRRNIPLLWRSIPANDKRPEQSAVQNAVNGSCPAWTAGLCIRLHPPAFACSCLRCRGFCPMQCIVICFNKQ